MSSFDAGAWQNTPTDQNGDRNPPPSPDGTYEVILKDGKAFTANSGDDYVVLTFEVSTGDQAGYAWDELRSFKSDGARGVTKTTLSRLGIDVDSLTALDDIDQAVKGKVGDWFTVDVKQNPKDDRYRNVYVNGPSTPVAATDVPAPTEQFATAGAPASPATEPAEDDIPF
jgi:Protein of unknown function (DUF669)